MISERSLTLSERLVKPAVRIGLDVSGPEEILSELAEQARQQGLVNDQRVFLEHLKKREAEMSTGVGRGLAVPHAEVPGAKSTFVLGATLKNPIEYSSIDGVPVDVIFLIGGKPGEVGLHLQLLARIARMARQTGFLSKLREQKTSEGFIAVVEEAESSIYPSETSSAEFSA